MYLWGIPVEALRDKIDGFYIGVHDGQIIVVSCNGRGAAYGLLELLRMAGVSPWIWWGAVIPAKKDRLTIDDHFTTLQGASVEYRGIFLNDEDWSLRPWSYGNFEKSKFGTIGPKLTRRFFSCCSAFVPMPSGLRCTRARRSSLKFPAMKEYYRLCGERHPEFMGWSQVELDKKLYDRGLSPQRNTAFTDASGGEFDRYPERYAAVATTVKG